MDWALPSTGQYSGFRELGTEAFHPGALEHAPCAECEPGASPKEPLQGHDGDPRFRCGVFQVKLGVESDVSADSVRLSLAEVGSV